MIKDPSENKNKNEDCGRCNPTHFLDEKYQCQKLDSSVKPIKECQAYEKLATSEDANNPQYKVRCVDCGFGKFPYYKNEVAECRTIPNNCQIIERERAAENNFYTHENPFNLPGVRCVGCKIN